MRSTNRATAGTTDAAANPGAMQDERADRNKSNNIHGHNAKTIVSVKLLIILKIDLVRANDSQGGSAEIREKCKRHLHNAESPTLVEAELNYVSQSCIGVPPVYKQKPLN